MRYTNREGLGAIHIAVIRDQLDCLKTLLQSDRTLLCMETENAEANMLIHLAVKHNNMGMIRYLLSTRTFFHLFEDENESKNETVPLSR